VTGYHDASGCLAIGCGYDDVHGWSSCFSVDYARVRGFDHAKGGSARFYYYGGHAEPPAWKVNAEVGELVIVNDYGLPHVSGYDENGWRYCFSGLLNGCDSLLLVLACLRSSLDCCGGLIVLMASGYDCLACLRIARFYGLALVTG
jgi:hypothetical protein